MDLFRRRHWSTRRYEITSGFPCEFRAANQISLSEMSFVINGGSENKFPLRRVYLGASDLVLLCKLQTS
jgi:hypothetical protein